MSGKTPADYSSPFDKPVKVRPASLVPIWKRPAFRATYWIICLGLIGVLLWYIRSKLSGFESVLNR